MIERQSDKKGDTEREISSISWFTPQMAISRTNQEQIQESGASSKLIPCDFWDLSTWAIYIHTYLLKRTRIIFSFSGASSFHEEELIHTWLKCGKNAVRTSNSVIRDYKIFFFIRSNLIHLFRRLLLYDCIPGCVEPVLSFIL